VLVAVATAASFATGFRLQLVPKGGTPPKPVSPVVYRRDISDLQVQANGGAAVAIRAGQPGQVTVSTALSWTFVKPTVSESWHGGSLWLGVTCPKADPFGGCQASIVIIVPVGTPVQAQAGAGTVTVTGLSGPLHLSATSGLLMARDVSGPVWATVTSGSVIARDGLTSQHLSASAASGQLTLAFTARPQNLSIGVGAGSAEVTLPPGSRYHVVSSAGQGVVTTAPGISDAGSAQVIAVRVAEGAVTIGYPPVSR
jgi:hypothetical protein